MNVKVCRMQAFEKAERLLVVLIIKTIDLH